jgi:hypothetical protein
VFQQISKALPVQYKLQLSTDLSTDNVDKVQQAQLMGLWWALNPQINLTVCI